MDKTKYHIGYKFKKGGEIFPVQDNTSSSTHLIQEEVVKAMKEKSIFQIPEAMIIYRPDMRTNYISLMEREAFKNSKLPLLIIRNNKRESTTFTSKSLNNE